MAVGVSRWGASALAVMVRAVRRRDRCMGWCTFPLTWLLLFLAAGVVGGQSFAAEPAVLFGSEAIRLTAFFQPEIDPGESTVRLVFGDGREAVLPRGISASGARYTDGSIVFWIKGNEALLELDGVTHELTVIDPERDPWEKARRAGVQFRAIGQEPGWWLELYDDGRIRLALDYGETEITTRLSGPQPIDPREAGDPQGSGTGSEAGSGTTLYWTTLPTSPLDITVVIRREKCYDVMSGEGFPFRVSVEMVGSERTYVGCGRWLQRTTSPDNAPSSWRSF